MRLNREGRIEYRKAMDEFLDTVEFNPDKRISFSVEDLEELLFEKKDDHKVIAYFTKNLCKLDLSKVSFENVDFGTKDDGKIKDFSNTNINIDFDKCYVDNMYRSIRICNANFENVNLAKNDLIKASKDFSINFDDCNLKNTKLKFEYSNRYGGEGITFTTCDLSDNDISDAIIDYYEDYYYGAWSIFHFFNDCVLKNTGILFVIRENCTKEDIRNLLKDGKIEDCYICYEKRNPDKRKRQVTDSIYITSQKQKKAKAEKIKTEYEEYKKDYIAKKIEYVKKQVH